jgi:hypothetical protein
VVVVVAPVELEDETLVPSVIENSVVPIFMDKTNEDGKEDANSCKDDKDANSCNGRDNRKFAKLYIPKSNRSITNRGGVAAVLLVLVGVWLLGTVMIVVMIRTASTKDMDLRHDYSICGC